MTCPPPKTLLGADRCSLLPLLPAIFLLNREPGEGAITCGLDADPTDNANAGALIPLHAALERLRPSTGPDLEILGAKHRTAGLLAALPTALAFDFNHGLEGWVPVNDVENLRAEGGVLTGLALPAPPPRLRVQGRPEDKLLVKAQSAAGLSIGLYWITEDSPSGVKTKLCASLSGPVRFQRLCLRSRSPSPLGRQNHHRPPP